jgi:hypothetical protein
MWRINGIARLIGVTASVTFLAVAMMGATSASAATHTGSTTHISKSKTHKATTLAPAGCNSNNFCEYNKGNGGDLCFQYTPSTSGHTWPSACGDHNEGEYNRWQNAVYMFGYAGSGFGLEECYYLLYSGHYLLYNAKDYFQGVWSGGTNKDTCTDHTLEHDLFASQGV